MYEPILVGFYLEKWTMPNTSVSFSVDEKEESIIRQQHAQVVFRTTHINKLGIRMKEYVYDQDITDVTSKQICLTTDTFKLVIFICQELPNKFDINVKALDLIGHRGSGQNKNRSCDLLENTIGSFNNALLYTDCVEMDVQLSRNLIPIVYHDFVVDGTDVPVHSMTDTELAHLCPNIATLEKVLFNVNGFINLEIKLDSSALYTLTHGDVAEYVNRIVDTVCTSGHNKIFFSSFDLLVLVYLRMRLPHACVMLLFCGDFNESFCPLDFCVKTGLSGVVYDYKIVKDTLDSEVSMYNMKGMSVFVYNVFTPVEYKKCIELGVTGVITDNIFMKIDSPNLSIQ